MKKYLLALSIFAISLNSEIVVVANKDNPLSRLKTSELSYIFLKKTNTVQNGISVVAFDNKELIEQFYKRFLSKNRSQMNAYWSKMIFSNALHPPAEIDNSKILDIISQNKNSISYIENIELKEHERIKVLEIDFE